jgi:formylglycine-generating enzyme required for sulfatase activity
MAGNVWQWVEDCYHYEGAPEDGSAWPGGDCNTRVGRGGSWSDNPRYLRSANRYGYTSIDRHNDLGFRVARTLTP